MKKLSMAFVSIVTLICASSTFAAMSFTWFPAKDGIPNDFRGKLTRFYYQNSDELDHNQKPEAVVDVVRNDGRLVEIRFSGSDFAFGSTLHSEVGKNVWLILSDNHDAMNPGGVVTQFSVLNDENR